jgi:D-alanyl-lipoteichoic acid acyltransferase DltB (MBOAT superfamily)
VLFPTVEFAIFFAVVLPLSWLLMPRPHAWKPVMLGASYLFYAAADARFALLLAAVTVGNQLAAKAMMRAGGPQTSAARRICAAAVVLDLGLLGVFKYYGFFVDEVNGSLETVGLGLPLPLASIALPIGISFFTFQAISYVVDVQRGLLRPAPLLDLGLYLSFFPHLVAGPIVRAAEFLPQLERPRDPARVAVGAGVVLIAVGLVKKLAIADFLAREVVDPFYAVPEAFGSADAALALVAYTAQIYCDFSGYTDIAIGLALLLGIVFPKNFDRPLSARSLQDFWRRWHMTLTRYLRDYVYIPLGGNRVGPWRLALNAFLTMALCGLWHGAAWGFVLFGVVHGLYLAAETALRRETRLRLPAWGAWALTMGFVTLAFVLFRAPSLGVGVAALEALVRPGEATLWAPVAVLAVLAVFAVQLVPEAPLRRLQLRVESAPVPVLAGSLAVCVLLVAATVPSQGVPPFIYFQF